MDNQNPLIDVSMDIIMNAGDARNFALAAVKAAKEGRFEDAQQKLEQADKAIVEAHRAQTDVIQAEMNGEAHEICLLFIHAQDTLMTIRSEVIMAKEFIELYRMVAELKKERC